MEIATEHVMRGAFDTGVRVLRLLSGLCYWKSSFRLVIDVMPGIVRIKRYLPPQEDGIPSGDKYVERVKLPRDVEGVKATQDTVMGVSGEIFHLSMALLHDLTDHLKGDNYTLTIDATPGGVIINKTPKE